MIPILFVFSICYLAFMCNTVCDMETNSISFLTWADFEFNEDNSKLTKITHRAQTANNKARQIINPIFSLDQPGL